MPRFTVLMPTHNRADVVGCAIKSVLAQTEADFELLVVGDGCTDETASVVASFNDPRVRWFDLPKAPHFGYANRNVALKQSTGALIAFAAHDDLLFPDHLETLGELLTASGSEWAYSRPLWVSTDGVILPYSVNLGNDDERRRFLKAGNTIPAHCVIYTRRALERAGYWPENVPSAADWELWKRIVRGDKIAYLATPTTLHFSAIWRNSRFGAAHQARALLRIADAASWWPPVLKIPIPKGKPEQQIVSERLSDGGLAWCQEVRSAADVVINRLAWDMTNAMAATLHKQDQEAALVVRRGLSTVDKAIGKRGA